VSCRPMPQHAKPADTPATIASTPPCRGHAPPVVAYGAGPRPPSCRVRDSWDRRSSAGVVDANKPGAFASSAEFKLVRFTHYHLASSTGTARRYLGVWRNCRPCATLFATVLDREPWGDARVLLRSQPRTGPRINAAAIRSPRLRGGRAPKSLPRRLVREAGRAATIQHADVSGHVGRARLSCARRLPTRLDDARLPWRARA